jgi:GPI-anchor transamidase subunit GAA1
VFVFRVTESTLRTANNLLERLHASFFFYLMSSPSTFLKIGSYLPAPILVSVAVLFGGLGEYVTLGWVRAMPPSEKQEWTRRKRPILPALLVAAYTHLIGYALFLVISTSWYLEHAKVHL